MTVDNKDGTDKEGTENAVTVVTSDVEQLGPPGETIGCWLV